MLGGLNIWGDFRKAFTQLLKERQYCPLLYVAKDCFFRKRKQQKINIRNFTKS